jgi:VWFA-related protein
MSPWRTLLVATFVTGNLAPSANVRSLTSHATQQALRTSSTAIVADVVVRDKKGRPVTDLRRQDFQLFEDGVLQEIADVTLVAPGERPSGGSPRGGRRVADETATGSLIPDVDSGAVALVFDRLSPEARAAACKAAHAFVDTLDAHDLAGVFVSDLSLQTIQPYTRDKALLHHAIATLAVRATSTFDREAMREIATSLSAHAGEADASVPVVASAESNGRPALVGGRSPDVVAAPSVSAAQHNAWEMLARDQQGYATTNALLAVATALGSLPGRKTLLLLAEGLAIPPDVLTQFHSVVATANHARVGIYTVDVAGLRVHSADAETGREIRAIGNAGVEVGSDGTSQSSLALLERNEDMLRKDPRTSLAMLADETGGFLIHGTNDLARGLRGIDDDRRFHYLITYAPRNATFDGRWRTIKVKVPTRAVKIRARSGYIALRDVGAVPVPTSSPRLAR